MVQKSAKEEDIKDKGSKYRIYIPVYMELHIWEQMQYLLSLPLISSSFAPFLHLISTEWICWKSNISRSGPIYCHMFIFALEPACNNKQSLHISLLKGSRHCKLQPSFSSISTLFFITNLHHLELHYNAS